MSHRTASLCAFLLLGSLVSLPATVAFQKTADKDDDPKVESRYTIPLSTEAQLLDRKRVDLERERKTLGDAYDKVGKRNADWDEPARQAFELMARTLSDQIRPITTHYDVNDAAKKAIDAGCEALADLRDATAVRLRFRAERLYEYGWQSRGNGFAGEVDPDGGRKFAERLGESRKALLEAWKLEPNEAWTPAMMVRILKCIGGESGDVDAEFKTWFDRAMKADPDNVFACEEMIDVLDPKWHGSRGEMLAFARECGKSANPCARISLVIAEAHERIAHRSEDAARKRYLQRRDVRKEIDDAFVRYFMAVPDDRFQKSRYAIDLYYAGFRAEANELFEQSEDFFRPVTIYELDTFQKIRKQVRESGREPTMFPSPLSPLALFRRWEKLDPPAVDASKSDDRQFAEWIVEQGGKVYLDVPKGKTRIEVNATTGLPATAFSLGAVNLHGRTIPTEMPSMSGCKRIESLFLERVDLRPAEVKRFGDMSNLRTLVVIHSPVVDDAVIAELARHASTVKMLDLSNTGVTDQGVRELEKLKVQTLVLTGPKITDKAIDSFAKMADLRRLRMQETSITDVGFQRLRKARPQLMIVDEAKFNRP